VGPRIGLDTVVKRKFPAPAGTQLTETVSNKNYIYFSSYHNVYMFEFPTCVTSVTMIATIYCSFLPKAHVISSRRQKQ
jgi:hypothetical protein